MYRNWKKIIAELGQLGVATWGEVRVGPGPPIEMTTGEPDTCEYIGDMACADDMRAFIGFFAAPQGMHREGVIYCEFGSDGRTFRSAVRVAGEEIGGELEMELVQWVHLDPKAFALDMVCSFWQTIRAKA